MRKYLIFMLVAASATILLFSTVGMSQAQANPFNSMITANDLSPPEMAQELDLTTVTATECPMLGDNSEMSRQCTDIGDPAKQSGLLYQSGIDEITENSAEANTCALKPFKNEDNSTNIEIMWTSLFESAGNEEMAADKTLVVQGFLVNDKSVISIVASPDNENISGSVNESAKENADGAVNGPGTLVEYSGIPPSQNYPNPFNAISEDAAANSINITEMTDSFISGTVDDNDANRTTVNDRTIYSGAANDVFNSSYPNPFNA